MKRYLALVVLLLGGWFVWVTIPQAQTARPTYIAPIDGDGTDASPFRPRCMGMPGAGHIDLRPFIVGLNRHLCTSDSLPANMTGVVVIGNSLIENLTPARRTALQALVGKTIAANTVDRAIVELLLPKIKPGRDGKQKIYLGGQVPIYQQTAGFPFNDHGLFADAKHAVGAALEPALAWATTLATETFNCADNASLTCVHTWTEFTGTALAIVSNEAKHTGTGTNEARLDADLATDDMEVRATLSAFVAGTEARCGVIGRKDSTATRTFYTAHATFDVVPATSEWRLTERNAGAGSDLGTSLTDPVAGDEVTLRTDGSSISLYANGSLLIGPVTDATITGNTRGGIMSIGAAATDSCTFDNVQVYDYPLPAAQRRGSILWFN